MSRERRNRREATAAIDAESAAWLANFIAEQEASIPAIKASLAEIAAETRVQLGALHQAAGEVEVERAMAELRDRFPDAS